MLLMEIAVRADEVSKHYDMYRRPVDRLVEVLTRRRRHVVFSALDDVTFEVEKGETVGIIGQNGAGKSTLLKLLCGVARPSSGSLSTHGTIASILELGTGFHPEFSGRDNAALNATILGLTQREVRERLPQILEFSELGSFVDRPVKTYSSGMYMRLAFSVAVNVSKHYDMYRRPMDRLIELLTRRQRHVVFPALEGVSFEVERGETVGIIGQNGAGKSTLLKLLCGVARPSSGSLSTNGTIASILELGTGFHPEFSGRDNAALNATILGLTQREVRERLPQILEFSELGSFVDRPVKTYSSGMYMRLAFSVAVNINPDILVIDEALAVGDGHFQKKCIDKIREFQEEGKTILFCSHALYYITSICRRTLWLDQGRLMRYGPSVDVVHE